MSNPPFPPLNFSIWGDGKKIVPPNSAASFSHCMQLNTSTKSICCVCVLWVEVFCRVDWRSLLDARCTAAHQLVSSAASTTSLHLVVHSARRIYHQLTTTGRRRRRTFNDDPNTRRPAPSSPTCQLASSSHSTSRYVTPAAGHTALSALNVGGHSCWRPT